MTGRSEEALEVLREIWAASGQDGEALAEELGPAKSCKNMQNVSFDGMAGSDGDLRSAWRDRLRREGKLSSGSGTVADLIGGQAEVR